MGVGWHSGRRGRVMVYACAEITRARLLWGCVECQCVCGESDSEVTRREGVWSSVTGMVTGEGEIYL